MGVEHNECVIATTWDEEVVEKIKDWVATLDEEDQELFAFIPSLINYKTTVVLGPDGSKKGWPEAAHGERLRQALVAKLKSFDHNDSSSPFSWVEVGYGELGQEVLRGNCRNMYD